MAPEIIIAGITALLPSVIAVGVVYLAYRKISGALNGLAASMDRFEKNLNASMDGMDKHIDALSTRIDEFLRREKV